MRRNEAYKILELDVSASEAEIKSAYRKLAKTCHPDLHPKDKEAEEKFKLLSQAHEILIKPATQEFPEPEDLHAEAFNAFFRRTRYREARLDRKPRPGIHPVSLGDLPPLRVPMTLTELLLRKSVSIAVTVREACSDCLGIESNWEECKNCEGKGALLRTYKTESTVLTQSSPCLTCSGRGWLRIGYCKKCQGHMYVDKAQIVNITVPGGYRYGQSLTLHGKGNVGWRVPVGNLIVHPIIEFPDLSKLNTKDSVKLSELLEKGYAKSK